MKEIIAIVWKDKTITHKQKNKIVTKSVDEFIYQSLKNQIVPSKSTKTK
jgi:hypothetical protein